MALLIILAVLIAFVGGLLVGQNNSKKSLSAKLDAEIGQATGDAAKALTTFKGKL